MRLEARRDELDALVKEFEFGLKPNTISIVGDVPTSPVKVTVTSQDAENKDMNALNQETLLSKNNSNTKDSIRFCILEGVWITTKMTDVGFVITNIEPDATNSNTANIVDSLRTQYLHFTFESMDALLHTVSPLFRDKFQEQLFNKLSAISQEDEETE